MSKLKNIFIIITITILGIIKTNALENLSTPQNLIFEPNQKKDISLLALTNGFEAGSGTANNPYQINTADQLHQLAVYVNNNNTSYNGKYYILTNDIDLSTYSNWTPIGFGSNYSFKGHFDGNGYSIKNMNIEIDTLQTQKASYGLFGFVSSSASITNIELYDSKITLSANKTSAYDIDIGLLVGHIDNNASVINCIIKSSEVEVKNTFELGNAKALKIGGVIGDAGETANIIRDMRMENIYSEVNITVDDNNWPSNNNTNRYYQFIIGGIVGRLRRASNFPKNCIYSGEINSKYAFIGPIYGNYRYEEGSTINDYDKMYIAYSANGNTNEFDNESNYFYKYKVNNIEITSDYKTSLASRIINNNKKEQITIYTIDNIQNYNNEYYMKNYQGINRGEFLQQLTSKINMYNNYINQNLKRWYYDNKNDTFSFRETVSDIIITDLGNLKYKANTTNIEGTLSYKWYINDIQQEETTSQITINIPLIDTYLKVEVYNENEQVGTASIFIEEFKIKVSLSKETTEQGDIYHINYENVPQDSPILNNYTFAWYEIEKDNNSEYIQKLLPCTEDTLTVTNSKIGYKVELINQNTTRKNQELYILNNNVKFIFVSYESAIYPNGHYYYKGDDNNTGDSPTNAIQTLDHAYQLLDNDKSTEEQYIIIIGRYLDEYTTVNYSSNKNKASFSKPATITGKFFGQDYYGSLYVTTENYINASTNLNNLTIASSDTADKFFYAQGNDLEFGKNINMDIIAKTPNGFTNNAPAFNVVAGFYNYKTNNHINDKPCHITIKSGHYARILGGNRNSGDYTSYQNYGLAFTPDNPLNVIIDIDIENKTNPKDYDYDINLLVGGQTDGSSYMNAVINIKKGTIGRLVGGTQGYGHLTKNNYPVDSYFGSVTTNISGGTIGQLYSGPLGRNTPTSYLYGKMVTNITGGIIEGNIFGSGAGGVSGFSNNASLYDDSFEVVKSLVENKTMTDIEGNDYRLDKTTSEINISGGIINGSIYGGGYGYSSMLPDADSIAIDGGSLYGNVSINISGGTIEDSVYGGGKGTSFYGDDRNKLANIYGNVSINITGNPTIKGNIYGGAEGLEQYEDMAKVIGNITLNIDTDNINFNGNIYGGGAISNTDGNVTMNLKLPQMKNIYGGGNAGTITGDVELNINGGTISEKIFGGGNAGDVLGSIYANIDNINTTEIYGGGNAGNIMGGILLNIDNSTIEGNIYGGCNSGDIYQTVTLQINESEANEIYGGGLSGNVSEYAIGIEPIDEEMDTSNFVTTHLTINSGTYKNIFGGGNLGKVFGDTYVKIGTEDNATKVTGVVYGGGRGANSEFETVTGSSNVLITGKDTEVNNYGSTKLGKVIGNVFLMFKNYYVNNPTNRYKIMNGIDRATTVTFQNSYVLLENIIDGELRGIEDIENIVLPEGSGLKISANGNITGNFIGGGKLYLDSAVCLTVDGDISGTTTLVLNPKFAESGVSLIIGKIDNPYMIVKGNSEAANTEQPSTSLISADGEEYDILTQKSELTNNYTYYYIKDTVEVNDYINETSMNTKNKKYTSFYTETEDIDILNNRSFTSSINIFYSFLDDGTKQNKYKNIYKTISIEDVNEQKIIPKNTKITMIYDNKFYYYILEEDTLEIGLGNFISYDNEQYDNNFSIASITDPKYVKENIAVQSKMYTYPEDYRFIFDFSNCNTYITSTSYVKINIIDNNELEDITNLQTNMIKFLNRTYSFDSSIENYVVTGNEIIVNTNIEISALPKNTVIDNEYLGLRVTLLSNDDEIINIPDNTEVIINNNKYIITNGIATFKLLDDYLSPNKINKNTQFKIDLSNILLQDKLKNGNYKLKLEYGFTSNDLLKEKIKYTEIIPFEVKNYLKSEFVRDSGLKATLIIDNNIQNNKLNLDKQKLIEYKTKEKRTINIEYNSNLNKGNIIIRAMKKTNDAYEECDNITFDTNNIALNETYNINRNITATFSNKLDKGIYRIYVDLLDEYGNLITQDYLNFVVYD